MKNWTSIYLNALSLFAAVLVFAAAFAMIAKGGLPKDYTLAVSFVVGPSLFVYVSVLGYALGVKNIPAGELVEFALPAFGVLLCIYFGFCFMLGLSYTPGGAVP